MKTVAHPVHRMSLPRFDLEAPDSVDRACELLAQAGPEARVLAGGTDLLLKMKRGELRPRLLIALSGLHELGRLDASDGGLAIGPLCTMARLDREPLLAGTPWAGLAEGAGSVGGPIIRNRATVGGNIANARPCADSVPPLITLGARLELRSREGGRRVVPLEGIITGPGEIGIRPDELIAAIVLPAPAGPAGSTYLKITRRAAMEVTLVGCACSVVLDAAATRVEQARIALTSVAPVPLRVPPAEQLMAGVALSDLERAAREAGEAARQTARPIDDHRAPAFYRSELVAVTVRRALTTAALRARGGEGGAR
jgi:CO/xanthine dehydrogenase FAD-binding subunit